MIRGSRRPVSQGGGVSAVITPKKRAMAVKVDKVIGVSGFIHPGEPRRRARYPLPDRKGDNPNHQDCSGECARARHRGRNGQVRQPREAFPGGRHHPGGHHPKTVRSSRWRQAKGSCNWLSETPRTRATWSPKGPPSLFCSARTVRPGQVSNDEQPAKTEKTGGKETGDRTDTAGTASHGLR